MRLMVLLNSIMIIIGEPDENDFIIHNDSLNKSHQPWLQKYRNLIWETTHLGKL